MAEETPDLWVNARSGVVHSIVCSQASIHGWRWSPQEAQEGDRPCRFCLPDGLPEH